METISKTPQFELKLCGESLNANFLKKTPAQRCGYKEECEYKWVTNSCMIRQYYNGSYELYQRVHNMTTPKLRSGENVVTIGDKKYILLKSFDEHQKLRYDRGVIHDKESNTVSQAHSKSFFNDWSKVAGKRNKTKKKRIHKNKTRKMR